MPACPPAELIARYQCDGCLFPIDCLVPDEIRHYPGHLKTCGHEQEDAFGRDEHGNFDLEPRPICEFDPVSRAVQAALVVRSFDFNNLLTVCRRSGNGQI